MAVITGLTGNVAFGGTGYDANITSWTLDYEKVALPISAYGDTIQKNAVGIASAQGEFTCRLDDTTMPTEFVAAGGSLTLTQSTGKAWTFSNVIFTSYNIEHSLEGVPQIRVRWINGTGAVTFPT